MKIGFRVAVIALEWGPPVAMDQVPTASTRFPEANLETQLHLFNWNALTYCSIFFFFVAARIKCEK